MTQVNYKGPRSEVLDFVTYRVCAEFIEDIYGEVSYGFLLMEETEAQRKQTACMGGEKR